ncbi:unnamed protein product [Penicillium camemberti]|uniref:Str. FM013 n=1 Tax=Penicillium camemberti (strain FM 013) TaxID=1429867 RepID=A0A0G4PLR5_PENC3|nr:unnamed protein product [Penicillium camemberti]
MTVIDGEFQRLESIEEICFDEDVMTFLQDAQATLKYKGIYNLQGPFKSSLIHYAVMGDCAELLLYSSDRVRLPCQEQRDRLSNPNHMIR